MAVVVAEIVFVAGDQENSRSGGIEFARDLHRHGVISVFLFVMLLHTYSGALDLVTWPAIASMLIMLLGAPHGALDVAIASRRRPLNTTLSRAVFIMQYLGLAALVVIMWWLVPGVSLAAFLLVSAYHFGGDWMPAQRHGSRAILGLAVLSATSLLHVGQVEIIFSLLAPTAQAATVAKMMAIAAPIVIAAAGLVVTNLAVHRVDVAFEFSVVLAAAVLLPPITFFVTYFCLLHSIRHIFEVRSELPELTPRRLIRAGWPYAVLAVFGSLFGAAIFSHVDVGPALLASVFVTLAALTVPHIVLVDCVRPAGG